MSKKKVVGKEKIQQNTTIVASPAFIQGIPSSKKPIQGDDVEKQSKWDEYLEDPEILKLMYIMINRSKQNKRWLYNNDNALKASGYMLANAVIGATGLETKTNRDDVREALSAYFKAINTNKIIQISVKDQICFADSLFWKEYDFEKGLIIPRWIDYLTVRRIKNKYTGDVKWIQATYLDSRMPKKDGKEWEKYEPYLDYFNNLSSEDDNPMRDKLVKAHIMEDEALNFNYFPSPLIDSIVEVVLWKKWMQYDAKLGGQKYATPLMDVEVTRPESEDLSSEESAALMAKIAEDLSRMMNFGVLAHGDAIKLQSISQQGQVFNYVQYLEYADKQIHKGVMVSANLLEASGSELATSRTVKDMFNIVITALRKRYINTFTDLALEYLYFIGMDVDETEFQLIFSEDDAQQQMTQNEEFNAVMQLFDRGVLRDENEVRKYVAKFGMDLDQLSEEEIGLKAEEELQQMLLEQELEIEQIQEQGKIKAEQQSQAASQTKTKTGDKK